MSFCKYDNKKIKQNDETVEKKMLPSQTQAFTVSVYADGM
jgi:hypothetical protein